MILGQSFKNKTRIKNREKQKTPGMSTGLNQIRPVFNMIWHLKDFQRFKDLKNFPRRTTSDKVLRDKAFEIGGNP